MVKKQEEKKSISEVKKSKKEKNNSKAKKENILSKMSNFIGGIKTEFKRVKWPARKDMVKYSTATIIFIVSFSVFFYLIDIIIAALHSIG